MEQVRPYPPREQLSWLQAQVAESVRVHEAINALLPALQDLAEAVIAAFEAGKRVYFCGNGGSAADAQHWAAELSGRFYLDRPGLPAFALGVNGSELTAIGNDYGYEWVFARPLQGFGQKDDLLIGISTSGNSANVIRAIEVAKAKGMKVATFTGRSGGQMKAISDWCFQMPSDDVARIQEGHELCGHLLCAIVERVLFGA